MERAFHLARNDYDRIGHFAQGFVPAIAAREILLRRGVVRGRGWPIALVAALTFALLGWSASVARAVGSTVST